MLEAKFQEEKLKLQQKHDGTVQKVMRLLILLSKDMHVIDYN